MKLLSFLMSLTLAGVVHAQTQGVEFHSSTAVLDALTGASEAENGLAVLQMGDRGGYHFVTVRRDKTGEAEIHESWDDFIVLQEGTGILRYGGTHAGGRETAPGEIRGGEITGGSEQRMAPGDVAVVPAGLPHQFAVEPGRSVTYLVVKIPGGSAAQRP